MKRLTKNELAVKVLLVTDQITGYSVCDKMETSRSDGVLGAGMNTEFHYEETPGGFVVTFGVDATKSMPRWPALIIIGRPMYTVILAMLYLRTFFWCIRLRPRRIVFLDPVDKTEATAFVPPSSKFANSELPRERILDLTRYLKSVESVADITIMAIEGRASLYASELTPEQKTTVVLRCINSFAAMKLWKV